MSGIFKDGGSGCLDIWVGDVGGDPHISRMMGGFRHSVARRMTGRQPWRKTKGRWDYLPLKEDIREEGFEEVEVYINWRKDTVAQYITT